MSYSLDELILWNFKHVIKDLIWLDKDLVSILFLSHTFFIADYKSSIIV